MAVVISQIKQSLLKNIDTTNRAKIAWQQLLLLKDLWKFFANIRFEHYAL
jgi:hypothetical protein